MIDRILPMRGLEGKRVVVTGGNSGIGAATVARFREEGCEVFDLSRHPGDGGIVCDVGDLDQVKAAFAQTGAPDVVVNNAGSGRWLFTEETTPAEAEAMIAVPYLAAFAVTRALLPAMLARRSGCVVNVTSPAAFCPWPGATAYTVARWAMRGFSEALSADLYRTGVHVALIVPGEVRSPYFEHNPGSHERLPRIARRLYRTLEVEEVAALVVRAVRRERRTVVAPLLLRATLAAHRLLPRPVEWLVRATGARRAGG